MCKVPNLSTSTIWSTLITFTVSNKLSGRPSSHLWSVIICGLLHLWSIITLWPITFVAYYICGQLLHLWLIITFVVDYYICGQLLHLWLQHKRAHRHGETCFIAFIKQHYNQNCTRSAKVSLSKFKFSLTCPLVRIVTTQFESLCYVKAMSVCSLTNTLFNQSEC